MTTPEPADRPDPAQRPPSVLPGMVLLVLAAVLIVIVLINPEMESWLRITIAVLAVLTVLGLLGFAFKLFRHTMTGGRK